MKLQLLSLVVLAGCATVNPATSDDVAGKQAAIFTSSETGTIMGEKPRASVATLPQAPSLVWLAVKKVYADIDVPLTVDNPAGHQLGNPNFYKVRQFAGEQMHSLVDCGSGMTGPKAASYRIYSSLLTTVDPDGKGGSIIKTTFVPVGQDMSGGSTDRIPCGSTGRLEILVNDRVKAALSK